MLLRGGHRGRRTEDEIRQGREVDTEQAPADTSPESALPSPGMPATLAAAADTRLYLR